MKNILIIYFSIIFLFLSCNTNRKILSNCSEYKILDSIAYVDFPDIYSTQGGNNVFNKILSYKNDINLCLIEKIKDTALSNYKYADSFYFLNGDIAFFMLTYNNPTDDLIINELFFKEFKKYYWDKKVGYIYMYPLIFFSDNSRKNYKNRMRLYNRIKKYYKSRYKK